MSILLTVAVWIFGVVFVAYLVICEFLDTIGRLEIVEARWPRVYRAMSNRPMRLVLIIFLLALVAKDSTDRAKDRLTVVPLVIKMPVPPAPIIVQRTPAPITGKIGGMGRIVQKGNNNQADPVIFNGTTTQRTNGNDSPIVNGNNNTTR